MSRDERFGTRSLIYSKWHRLFLGDTEPMIDLDGVEYCAEKRCNKALVLVETAMDIGQRNKPTTVMRELAKQAGGVLAICVLYKVTDGIDPAIGCPCKDSRDYDPACDHGITRFRVRRVWPSPARLWTVMTPEEFRDKLRAVRMNHIAAEHHTWDVA